jgi:HJR/Mrr/RecB family endonuclease
MYHRHKRSQRWIIKPGILISRSGVGLVESYETKPVVYGPWDLASPRPSLRPCRCCERRRRVDGLFSPLRRVEEKIMRDILFEKTRVEAEKGDAKAQYNLGVLYYYGNGVAQDHKVAEQWFCKAAAQGHTLAQDRLRKAAEQGSAPAQYSLGEMYYYGRGVAEDEVPAVQWYRKAAGQGHSLAQARLREMATKGILERQIEKFLQEDKNLVDKFLEIAERKVSRLDEYGHENWKVLPKEIMVCIEKLREMGKENSSVRETLEGELKEFLWSKKSGLYARSRRELKDYPAHSFCYSHLKTRFENYHDAQKKRPKSDVETQGMSGVEFEMHVARLLRDKGYAVQGTPATGDQGADLIVTRNGRKIIIQVKKYTNASVGNDAVQQVAAARSHYRGDEAWVITNSVFTPAAKDLARSNEIRLIDGDTLKKNNF